MNQIRVLGIAGNLGNSGRTSVQNSGFNRAALQAAQELAPAGVQLSVIELQDIPAYDQNHMGALPAAVIEFKQQILSADAVMIATAEYKNSIPEALQNAIDWTSQARGESIWKGKLAALVGVSTSRRSTARAQHHLREILPRLGMPVLDHPEITIANAAQHFDLDGRLNDGPSRKLIKELLTALVQLTSLYSPEPRRTTNELASVVLHS